MHANKPARINTEYIHSLLFVYLLFVVYLISSFSCSGFGGVTRTLCVHFGLRSAHLLAGWAERGSRPIPAQLHAGVADGVLQPIHGSVCSGCTAHPADLGLHGQLFVHRLLFDGRFCHQSGEYVAW